MIDMYISKVGFLTFHVLAVLSFASLTECCNRCLKFRKFYSLNGLNGQFSRPSPAGTLTDAGTLTLTQGLSC